MELSTYILTCSEHGDKKGFDKTQNIEKFVFK